MKSFYVVEDSEKTELVLHAMTGKVIRLNRSGMVAALICFHGAGRRRGFSQGELLERMKIIMSEKEALPKSYEPMTSETRAAIQALRAEPLREIEKSTYTLMNSAKVYDDRQQQRMTEDIETEAKAAAEQAAEAVRARYRNQNPQTWNDGVKQKAMRGLVSSIRESKPGRR